MQIKIFLICLACGVLSGAVYDFLYIIRRAVSGAPSQKSKKREFICTAVCDLLYVLALSAIFVAASVYFCFPDVRLYMFAAVAIGFVLYVKSFHIIVAFFVNRLYNSIGRIVKVGKRGKKGARRRRKTNKFAVKEVNE